jgi:signal transduction histidine kinase/ActR/RegA family two-component response regulator
MLSKIASSIRGKLLLLIAAVTFLALFVSGVSLMVYEARTYHERWVSDLQTQADILGSSTSAALAFDDRSTALQNLELLRGRPAILAAAVYTEDGALFASFTGARSQPLPSSLAGHPTGSDAQGEYITLVTRIVEGNTTRGYVYLRATYGLTERMLSYAGILSIVMLLSLVAAMLIGSWLQQKITEPILAVAQTAHRVIETRDFSLRVDKKTTDEVAYLVDAFNSMLAEIGVRSEALVKADRMKDQFLATLAHELRNPLAPISNALHILKVARNRPDMAQEARSMMERQLKQLVRLVDDLLDVSRITTGKLMLRREQVILADVLTNAIEIARPLIDSHGHRLVTELPAGSVTLAADATRLAQVFSNLLSNAAKYTDSGGRIDLTAHVVADHVIVEVKDNGIGMSPELLPDVFNMFTQATAALERTTQAGLGVGLALAKHLVELHGGTIDAYSEGLGRGSRFTVRLPIMEAATVGIAPLPTAAHDAGRPYRIVIIDDNIDFADSLALILKELGHEVHLAYDGLSGLRTVEDLSPDLAFVDLGLPVLSGHEVARRLRGSGSYPALVLVAVSGWGQDADKARSAEAGFDIHIVKPLEPTELGSILERVHLKHGSRAPRAHERQLDGPRV